MASEESLPQRRCIDELECLLAGTMVGRNALIYELVVFLYDSRQAPSQSHWSSTTPSTGTCFFYPRFSDTMRGMASKKETEREISKAIIRFEKEFMGRGPLETRSYIIDDMVLVRLRNVLTPAELKLAESEDHERGRYLIKQMRQELIERGRPLLDAVIREILKVEVVSLHTDISAKTGERIIVFTLEEQPEFSA